MKPQMASESKKAHNVSCSLLTQEENQKIFTALGKQCTTLSTTVVQLFLTEEPYHSNWQKKCCGVLCFVKDCERRSYFMKLYDMDRCSWVWEQELYNQFTYKPACTFFHVFEADNSMGGFNFADNDEAYLFKTAVQKKLQIREERKKERRKTQSSTTLASNAGIVAARAKSQSSQSLANGKEEKKDKKKRKKITKDDIGQPSNFLHLQHVGWHPEKGFNLEGADQELQDFFNLAGVSDKDLNDAETRNFIYDFIANHGGVERARQETEIHKITPPPVPVRDIPQTPRSTRTARTIAPPPPPPPPIHPPAQHPPPVHSTSKLTNAPPPPPPPPPPVAQMGGVAPPPPPPPPPPPGMLLGKEPAGGGTGRQPNPPPPPPMDNRSALLEQIKKGRELHHVEVNGNSDQGNDDAGGDSRNALLNQIRRGVVLKAVSEDQKPAPTSSSPTDGLAGALARALLERSKAIQPTDESDTSEDDDGDDWE